MKMRIPTIFVTGTDTGVGKTVLTCLLAQWLRMKKISVAALKPVCSGGRGDARRIYAALEGALPLDQINPWHFRAPLSPSLAARLENRKVDFEPVLSHVRAAQKRFAAVLVEGAGGLLSPLGRDFDSRRLMLALRATPVVVCPNRLGALNQVLLVLAALPKDPSRRAQIVLSTPRRPDRASRTNPKLLRELLGNRVHLLPRLDRHQGPKAAAPVLRRLARALTSESPAESRRRRLHG